MENTNEENISKENVTENKSNNNKIEKIIIAILLIISCIIMYGSLYYIHYIKDRNVATDSATGDIDIDGNKDDNKDNKNSDSNIIIDNTARFKILQNKTKDGQTNVKEPWVGLKELNVFNNPYFNNRAMIAPGVEGFYNFTVENTSTSKFTYDIVFGDENNYKINLKYRFKVNGKYIAGNENTYVSLDELNRSNIIINANSEDVYSLEWKWIDTENDTEIGTAKNANYKMTIEITATQIVE